MLVQRKGRKTMDDDVAGTVSAALRDPPVVQTESGQVRGAIIEGVAAFKCIPYGAPTSGANRFMPPRKPSPWTGVRDALAYTGHAPQAGLRPTPRPSWRISPGRPTPRRKPRTA
jgi:hypothetical protein